MALTPDPRNATLERLNMLRSNRTIVVHALKRMVSSLSVDGDQNDSSSEDDDKSGGSNRLKPKSPVPNSYNIGVTNEPMIMEMDDVEEEKKCQQQIKDLENDVNRVLAKEKQDTTLYTLSNKSNDDQTLIKPLKTADITEFSTPPRPRRATCSRTNSLESNGVGVAPGSPFQNNPLLVSHDYSKSPMLMDQENEDITDLKATADENIIINEAHEYTVEEASLSTQGEVKNIDADKIELDKTRNDAVVLDCKDEKIVEKENVEKSTPQNKHQIDQPLKKVDHKCTPKESTIMSNAKPTDISGFDPKLARLNSPHRFSPSSLLSLLRNIEVDISDCRSILQEANERRRRHAIDDCRRSHDYDQFITAFLSMLAERGHLGNLLEHGISVAKKKYQNTNGNNSAGGNSAGGSEGSSDNESNSRAKKMKAKKALMKKKGKAKGVSSNSVSENKQKSKGRGRPKKTK